ncbi:MAG: hypothetical protein CMP66_02395, partial [Flavobacteriales bacterium]|nr:hypothetical protein [Flavobacteriales bacterium]
MRDVYIRLENLFISIFKWLFPVLIASSIFIGKAYGQCAEPTGLTESNITLSSATVSWNAMPNVDYYRLSYRQLGGVWQFATNPINIDPSITSVDLLGLQDYSTYEWRVKTWCTTGLNSSWTEIQSFTTLSSLPLDCNGDQNGSAFIDTCGNCVGGNTGDLACISFSPSVSVALASQEVGATTDLTFTISQDANEPDMVSALVTSDGGSFNLSSLNTNDVVGSGTGVAGGGYFNSNFTLYVDFILSSNHVSLRAIDSATSNLIGTFELENTPTGIKILSISPADNNNITAGNSQIVTLTNLYNNPVNASTLNFYSSINSELSDFDNQVFPITIDVTDCNGDFGGSAYVDNCNNCVGGNTGLSECIPFSPVTVVTLADSACTSTTDLEITVSQDPNEPDMSTSFFSSNAGAFNFNNISIGQTIGFASLSAAGGDINFNANLIVVSILNNQLIVSAINQLDGTVMGSFTISNNNPGIAIVANPSYNDGNNVTLGNTSQVIFYNLFQTPDINESLSFFSVINSETGNTSNEVIDFGILCPCINTTSTTDVTACDSYVWNGTSYDATGVYTFTTTNASGCDSTATLNLTINNS